MAQVWADAVKALQLAPAGPSIYGRTKICYLQIKVGQLPVLAKSEALALGPRPVLV